MIIWDLEWNRGYDRTPLDEILQIGAVRVAGLGGPVLDTFNAYIRPAVHKKFDPGARRLPGLQDSRSSDLDFAGAMERFRTWCGGETEFASWGSGDLDTLTRNCRYWGAPSLTMEKCYDLQTAFSYVLGADRQIALWRAVEHCQIPDLFPFHDALYDSLYTSVIGCWLTPESLEHEPVRRGRRAGPKVTLKLSGCPFPRQPRQGIGPFPTPELVLGAKQSRRPPCPVCSRKGSISQWRCAAAKTSGGPRQCFSIFSCPEHGRFLCRLVLAQLSDGSWRGRRSVPPVGPELIQEYTAAFQTGAVYECRGNGRKRRRTRRPGPSSQACGPDTSCRSAPDVVKCPE